MKWSFHLVALLCLLACRDPNSYQPFDPTKPDPPAAPVLSYPANGWKSDLYVYPQNVDFTWQAVPGAQFYQLEVSLDSLFGSIDQSYWHPRVYQPSAADSIRYCGRYFWRVRAASSNWNDYTAWSDRFWFALPNPAR